LKIGPECIACILEMCLGFSRKSGLGDSDVNTLFNDVLQFPTLSGKNWDVTSATVVEQVMRKIYKVLGNDDPLRKQKAKLNRYLMDRYEIFEGMVRDAKDPLEAAVKLAISGNAIDVMVSLDFQKLVTIVKEKMEQPLPEKSFEAFKTQIGKTRRLVYFGDNAGEIVLDKLLISTLKKLYDLEIVFVVRSLPTLNDVTLLEARDIKMDEMVPVLPNGIDGPFPGTQVSRCSPEVQALFKQADLIISKGGGNFDSLEEDKEIYGQKISFLFLSKCYLYMKLLNTPLGGPILANYYSSCHSW
jgi:damage-control phosphatase, subfamily I